MNGLYIQVRLQLPISRIDFLYHISITYYILHTNIISNSSETAKNRVYLILHVQIQ